MSHIDICLNKVYLFAYEKEKLTNAGTEWSRIFWNVNYTIYIIWNIIWFYILVLKEKFKEICKVHDNIVWFKSKK